MSHRCYGCEQNFTKNGLSYECMCYHDESPHYRGVCHQCAKDKVNINVGDDPKHHRLSKIHQYDEKYLNFLKELDEKCPAWGGLFPQPDKLIVSHPNFPDGLRAWAELTEQQQIELAYTDARPRFKKTEFPITLQQLREMSKCICCQ